MATIKIKGMSCQHCVGSVKEALDNIDGIDNVIVDLDKGEATFDGESKINEAQNAISKIGFEVVD